MRFGRLAFIFAAFYLVFLGGSAYYHLIFPVRVFHHVFVTVMLGWWLLRRRKHGLPTTPLNLPIYGVVSVWLVTAAASIDPRMAFENLWFPITHVLLFFVLVDFLQRGFQRLVLETQFLLAAVVVFISGLELVSWYFGLGMIPGTEIGWVDVMGPGVWLPLSAPRLSLAMNVSTLLSGYVAPLILLAVGWGFTARRRDYRRVLLLLAVLLGVVLILTFSRGGIMSFLAGAGALAAMRLAQNARVTQRVSPRALLGAAGFAGVVAMAVFTVVTLDSSRRSGDDLRVEMWRAAVAMAADNPVIGVGPGLYGRALRDYRDAENVRDRLASAHNAYLNTAAETGGLGLAVSGWLVVVFLRTAWRTWQQAETSARKFRLEACFAGLVGLAAHSMVDAFTTTPLVLLMLLLVAYSITGNRRRFDPVPAGDLTGGQAGLILLALYGLFLFQLDRAQFFYQRSFFGGERALAEAQQALTIDPGLNLYTLHIAFLTGQQLWPLPEADLTPANEAYYVAINLESTWATGWINLAALAERQGEYEQALLYLEQAQLIDRRNSALLHWARLAERHGLAVDDVIVSAYVQGMTVRDRNTPLPLSGFWQQTDLRRAALEVYVPTLPLEWQYRIWQAHDRARLTGLLPAEPRSAGAWWVMGEDALSEDAAKAASYFTKAIESDRTNGDYYVARARAELRFDRAAAARDLNIARLLGTRFEYPNAVAALLASSPEEIYRLRVSALPARVIVQDFAAVLYGRGALFDVFPTMQPLGPGFDAMRPWYDIAAQYLADGRTEDARLVYRAILDYAPDELAAQQALAELAS